MSAMRTYQTRTRPDAECVALLVAYATLFCRVKRRLFVRLQRCSDVFKDIKREFLRCFGLTSRQFNAVSAEVKGKIEGIREARENQIVALKRRIHRGESVLKRLSNKRKIHHKKRRIHAMKVRLAALENDKRTGRIRLCFGSRKLFKAQFRLHENGFASHSAWRQVWQDVRNNQFMVLGSKDETGGCQGCQAEVAEDGRITLRIRLPDALCASATLGAKREKYVVLKDLHFNHGHDAIVRALGRNLSTDKNDWVALTYRFVADRKGWRVFVSTAAELPVRRSVRGAGVLGVDINIDHLAVMRVDAKGNPLRSWRIECSTYGKSAEQRRAVVGESVKQLMAIAVAERVPIALEKLDFSKKKAESEGAGLRRNRMLSGFAYAQIQTVLRARAYDVGIETIDVNPAWTSFIGEHKFAARYGLSRHAAAALVIGRRSMNLSERLPSQFQGTSCGSEGNRREHVWKKWARVSRKLQAAHAAPERPGQRTSLSRSPSLPRGPPMDDDVPF